MSLEIEIEFTLNGRSTRVKVPPAMTTLTMLREKLDLTGAKLACGEGECGACTVKIDDRTINSCLMFAVDCDGRNVQTIEGMMSAKGLDVVQQAFVDHGAIQCGYCMPGMIMQARYVIDTNPDPDAVMTREEIARGLEGNVCRCSGYTKVVDAVTAAMIEERTS
jgi:carbon-monoxide dehydrogenase small subunit